jgi:hypothetical protein
LAGLLGWVDRKVVLAKQVGSDCEDRLVDMVIDSAHNDGLRC